jgi:hypothetical protein
MKEIIIQLGWNMVVMVIMVENVANSIVMCEMTKNIDLLKKIIMANIND